MDTSSSEEELGTRSPLEIVLRGGSPWGFELRGGADETIPLQVREITSEGKADLSPLKQGDIILSINGLSCSTSASALQLIESAFRTLTLRVWRGNYESNVSRPPSYPSKLSVEYRANQGVQIQDDSAIYRQSKSSQSQGKMRPRQRRGESFNIAKSSNRREEKRTSHEPPWQRPPDNRQRNYPSQSDYNNQAGRRHSEAESRDAVSPGVSRSRQLVSAKSTPSLNQDHISYPRSSQNQPSISPSKSSPNIPENVGHGSPRYGQSRPNSLSVRDSRHVSKDCSSPSSAWSLYNSSENYQRPHSNMYMNEDSYHDNRKSDKHSRRSFPHLDRYRADYENISVLGTAPLLSEKISEIDDDEADMEGPVIPPRPKQDVLESADHHPPVPPVRDPSSLQYGRYNQAHEKYPSWPVTKANQESETGQPIQARAQSWTDHTNTKKDAHPGAKPRYLHNPSLRPVFEKTPATEKKSEDGKSARNQSDPGFKTEFVYDKYGRVVQKNYENIGKNKFEDLINSEPGYPPPKFDSDGHNYGDKEYSVPSPPERDTPGVNQAELSDKLTSSQNSVSAYKAPVFSSQFEAESMPRKLEANTSPLHSPIEDRKSPFQTGKSAKEKVLVDSSTSPLQSPQEPKPQFGAHRELPPSSQIQHSKAYIVKQTPYYNTSTQTDVSSYTVKTSMRSADPKQCNAEVQATDASGLAPTTDKDFEEKSIQARMSWSKKDVDVNRNKPVPSADSGKDRTLKLSGSSLENKPKFEGFDSIQAKYAADDFPEENHVESKKSVLSHYWEYDPSTQSMLRSLAKEYYGGRISHQPEKRLSSASSQDTSHLSGMKEAESYSSVVIHPSEHPGPFGRDDFGSKSSLSDSRADVSSISDSVSSRVGLPRGRYSLDPSALSGGSRPVHPRQNSASAVMQHRDKSSSYADSLSSSQRRSQESSFSASSQKTSYPSSDSSTPSQPKSSADTRTSGSTQYEESPPTRRDHDNRIDSYNDSVFTSEGQSPIPQSLDPASHSRSSDSKPSAASVGRQPSIKKAYGVYDETEVVSRPGSATDYVQMNNPNQRGSRSDQKMLDQIDEEGDSSSRPRSSSGADPNIYDSKYPRSSDWRVTRDKWKEETQRSSLKRTTSEQISQLRGKNELGSVSGKDVDKGLFRESDRGSYKGEESESRSVGSNRGIFSDKTSFKESDHAPFRDGDRPSREGDRNSYSDKGSFKEEKFVDRPRTSSTDGQHSQSNRRSGSGSSDLSQKDIELKKVQQQAVRSFMEKKTGKKSSSGSIGSEDVPAEEPLSHYDFIGETEMSPTQSVTDLINKTSENLNASRAQRADSLRRSGSSASSRHSNDYMDMAKQQRKETEWSRLRSQGSFNYSPDLNRSNRSSMCSDHQYEDISVFSPSTPRNSYPGSIRDDDDRLKGRKETGFPHSASMDAGLMASPTYQNLVAPRRPPPPPPRSPSPDEEPPALPPRNYKRHSEGHLLNQHRPRVQDDDSRQRGEEGIDRSKRHFGDLKRQFEVTNSPREDAYIAKVRNEARRRMSAQPMSIKYTKPTINYPTTIKREPMIAQEATSPSGEVSPICLSKSGPVEESNKENSAPPQGSKPPRERTLSDIPPPSPPRVSDAELISDGEELPPPPPDIAEEQDEGSSEYADDSYMSAAVRRSRRNSGSGNYKRSASAAALRPGEEDTTKESTDANSVFGDKKLGHQNWNSESALSRHSVGAVIGQNTMPNLQGNIPAFKADVEPVRGVSKGVIQPLQAQPLTSQTTSVPNNSCAINVAKPPQTLPTNLSSSLPRTLQLNSPTSPAGKAPTPTSSTRTFPQSPTSSVGGTVLSSIVKPVQSPSGSSRPSAQSAAMSKTSLFSPRPFVSHHSREGESGDGKKQSTPNSVRDRISRIEHGGNKNVTSPRVDLNRFGSPKHSVTSQPADGSWKMNPEQIRTSSPKTVGGQLKAESSWETMENLSQSLDQKIAHPVSVNNAQNSQRILEDWRDDQNRSDRSRYPRNESFSSSSSNSTVSSSNLSERRLNLHENPANSATSPQNQRYRQFTPTEHSAVDNRSPWASGKTNRSVNNQRDQRHFQNSASRRAEEKSSPSNQDQFKVTDSKLASPAYRDHRTRDWQPETNGVSKVGEPLNSRTNYSESERRMRDYPQSVGVSSDLSRTQENNESDSVFTSKEESNNKSKKSDSMDVPVHHGRQPSQEEIECDEQAKQLALELESSNKKLSEVLTQDHKRMKYIDGMFNETAEISRRPSGGKLVRKEEDASPDNRNMQDNEKKGALPATYFKSSSKALVEIELRRNEEVNKDIKDLQDNDSLRKQKEELMEKLYAKLKVLKDEKLLLQEEIDENETLGGKVCECVEKQARTSTEREKFSRFLDELDKIVRLMLNLSGQLVRAENAVQSLGQNTDSKIKKMTIEKRERLHAKYQDAKGLKQDIDERSESVATMLQCFLTQEEFDDYAYFIKMKSKLTIDRQDLEDKITLGEAQIQELKKSIPDN